MTENSLLSGGFFRAQVGFSPECQLASCLNPLRNWLVAMLLEGIGILRESTNKQTRLHGCRRGVSASIKNIILSIFNSRLGQ